MSSVNIRRKGLMNVPQNGFFDMEVDILSTVPRIILLSIFSIAFIIQCALARTLWHKMRQSQNISIPLMLCAAMCFFSAFYRTFWNIVYFVWAPSHSMIFESQITSFIHFFGLGLFWWTLLLILIIRLYITFKTSVYRMSNRLIAVFMNILSLSLAFWVMMVWTTVSRTSLNTTLFNVVGFSYLILYFTGCSLAIYYFVSNLHQLAKLRVTSCRNLTFSPKDIELDQQQQKLSDLSSKYMMLFGIAMISTILSLVFMHCVHIDLRRIFLVVDSTINLFCVYFQFSFAKTDYRRCCGWCDAKCRKCVSQRNRTMIYKHSIQMSPSHTNTNECSKIESKSEITV